MTKIDVATPKSKATLQRLIGVVDGKNPGPTLIFIGGIHGNEPSGVYALQRVIPLLESRKDSMKGKVYAIAGNLPALQKGVRYIDQDLNRMFTKDKVANIGEATSEECCETRERRELLHLFDSILETEEGPFYFFDLHTTSGNTIPFLTVNDSLLNRQYTKQYPVPNVLGIEEFLEGPLLSYINELGYIAFGFEAGQHDDLQSTENHFAFIMTSLFFSGVMDEGTSDFRRHYNFLRDAALNNHRFYEIIYRHKIPDQAVFDMQPGFLNFQQIPKGLPIAIEDNTSIEARYGGRIFMPLYQGKGEDGFFIIQKIPEVFLWLSKWLRNARMDRFLVWLPGISWGDSKHETLMVNRRIARFMAKQIFHLLGYRNKKIDEDHFVMKNRERRSRADEYQL